MSIDGFDEAQKKLERLQKEAEKLGDDNVPLKDLLTPGFIFQYSGFPNLEAFADAGGFRDFENADMDKVNVFVAKHTQFSTWDKMVHKAGEEYVVRRLDLS